MKMLLQSDLVGEDASVESAENIAILNTVRCLQQNPTRMVFSSSEDSILKSCPSTKVFIGNRWPSRILFRNFALVLPWLMAAPAKQSEKSNLSRFGVARCVWRTWVCTWPDW